MRKLLKTFFLCCCAAQGLAATPSLAADAAGKSVPRVSARFETTYCAIPCKEPKSRVWYLLRDEQTIELRVDGASYSELWRRQADGRIGYVYVMHDERRAIEYSPIDLTLIGRQPDWERIGALLSRNDISQLDPGAADRHDGFEARRYSGKLGAAALAVTWLPDLVLPASLERRYLDHTVTVRLVQHYLGSSAPVAPTRPETLARYQLVDYADLGDMEEDPQAQKWIRKALTAPGHEHHAQPH